METKWLKRRFGDRRAASAANEIEGFVRLAGYRLYGLDGVDKVSSGVWFEADDDQVAIEVAKQMMDGHDCELWQGRRRIARIKSEHKD